MKVLVTGGTGFIGSNLALHYTDAGHRVRVLAKEATDAERENANDLRKAGVEVILGSVTDYDLVTACCQDVDIVHHIAAAMREANIPDQVFWDTNVEATRHLLKTARQAGVKRFVYCSSIGAMGQIGQKPANEKTLCGPQDIYQLTKKAAEDLCLEFYDNYSLPVSIVRPADVYGPRDRRLFKLIKAIKGRRFAMIGSGNNERHMVYIDDLVMGFRLATEVEAAVGQIFIIAGEHPVTLNGLVTLIAEQLEVPIPSLRIPVFPVQALAILVESACKPFGIQPPIYRRRINFFQSDYAFDILKAKQVLGYKPRYDMEQGIRNTVEWYNKNGFL